MNRTVAQFTYHALLGRRRILLLTGTAGPR